MDWNGIGAISGIAMLLLTVFIEWPKIVARSKKLHPLYVVGLILELSLLLAAIPAAGVAASKLTDSLLVGPLYPIYTLSDLFQFVLYPVITLLLNLMAGLIAMIMAFFLSKSETEDVLPLILFLIAFCTQAITASAKLLTAFLRFVP